MPRATFREPVIGDSPEIFFKYTGAEQNRSVVLNASAVPADARGRKILRQGTILKKVAGLGVAGSPQYVKFDGSGTIAGILGLTQEFLIDGSSPQDRPAVVYFGLCDFRASSIVDYSTHNAALATALNTCKFSV